MAYSVEARLGKQALRTCRSSQLNVAGGYPRTRGGILLQLTPGPGGHTMRTLSDDWAEVRLCVFSRDLYWEFS
jgi:hypothetical protein